MKSSRAIQFTLICCTAVWMPNVARAGLIAGSQLQFTGNGQFNTAAIAWRCNLPGDTVCSAPPANTGDFAVAGSDGSFAQYNGTFGLIKNINNAGAQPLNQFFSLPNFISFDLNNSVTVELTFIPLGTDTLSATCAGLSNCTPQDLTLITPSDPQGRSAFNLETDATGARLTLGVNGIAHEIGGATANISGTFIAEFAGMNPQQALAAMKGGSDASYLATLALPGGETSAPEPTSLALSAICLVGFAFVRCRVCRS
jgi:hypothetical protein